MRLVFNCVCQTMSFCTADAKTGLGCYSIGGAGASLYSSSLLSCACYKYFKLCLCLCLFSAAVLRVLLAKPEMSHFSDSLCKWLLGMLRIYLKTKIIWIDEIW